MIPLFDFLIEPLDGRRYDNTAKVGGMDLIVSSSIENHRVTQRHAKVIEVPKGYKGPVKVDDTVIVHHNVFRKFYNMQGKESQSSGFIRENTFMASEQEIYLHKGKDSEWKAIYPFVFVSPIEEVDSLGRPAFRPLYGKMEYSCSDRISPGSVVSFEPECEYEFKIDGKLMYRMYLKNITTIH
jgi:hypothetical protein